MFNYYNTNKNMTLIRCIESWATEFNPMNSTDEILQWVTYKNKTNHVVIKKIDYNYTNNTSEWYYDEKRGEIRNQQRSFFQITGISKSIDKDNCIEQPIIIQKEIGYLGIIGKVIDGILYFLMQAKVEPGNVNKIQISPTIQATKSNFMQAHGGKCPAYLEYFSNNKQYEVIVDQIQSEQSSRFFGKRNRNIIIIVNDEIEVKESHRWMTLGQIKALMKYDNLVNMDTRTVISCIPFALRKFTNEELIYIETMFKRKSLFNSIFEASCGTSINKIYEFLNDVKMLDDSKTEFKKLDELTDWKWNNGEFSSKNGKFKIVFCNIEIEGREVTQWSQPLIEATSQGVFGLMICETDNVMHFLVHAYSEIGCFDKIELGPSVQTDLDENKIKGDCVDTLFWKKLQNNEDIEFDGVFSEEGGRFYHEQNRNVIMRVRETELPENLPEGYFWVDFQTLNTFIQFNNCLNIQLRNLLSILDL